MKYIESREELRAVYREPGDVPVRKEMRRLDAYARNFLLKSPFVLIGSQDRDGAADVTPKGDRPGFAQPLDDFTLLIPDRPGNNRLDTWENVIVNPAVGLLFVIPGMDETLRVNGEGRLTVDEDLRRRLAVDGKPAVSVLVVKIHAVYMHCAKAFMRSKLWRPDTWPRRSEFPTLGEIIRDQLALPQDAAELDGGLAAAYSKTMW
jgi:PPOX class probable FMN-dependent enzyme